MTLIKIQANVATREPVPSFLIGLPNDYLADLSWTDPALGVSDCGWVPEVDQTPQLGEYERYGDEYLVIDVTRAFVVSSKYITPWTAEEIAADKKSKIPKSIPMLHAYLLLIDMGLMDDVHTYLDSLTGVAGVKAWTYFNKALTMKRDHPLVLSASIALGKDEDEVDAFFTAADAYNA